MSENIVFQVYFQEICYYVNYLKLRNVCLKGFQIYNTPNILKSNLNLI